ARDHTSDEYQEGREIHFVSLRCESSQGNEHAARDCKNQHHRDECKDPTPATKSPEKERRQDRDPGYGTEVQNTASGFEEVTCRQRGGQRIERLTQREPKKG